VSIHIGKHEGTFPAWWSEIVVEINGLAVKPTSVNVGGHAAKFAAANHSVTISVTDDGKGIDVAIP
jgi:alpha-glucosidase